MFYRSSTMCLGMAMVEKKFSVITINLETVCMGHKINLYREGSIDNLCITRDSR